jgi:hypothetical protein
MPAEPREPTPWWRNPVIVVPAIAVILAAIIGGIITAVLQTGGGSGGASSSARTPTVSSPTASAAPAPTTGTTTPATTPVYYQRPIPVVISGNGPDFDTKPLGPGPGPASFYYNTFSLATGGSSTPGFGFAVWTKGGTPTASDCKTWVSTHLVDHVYAATAGMKICFGTDQGRIGLLVVQPGTSEDQFKAIASVWGS